MKPLTNKSQAQKNSTEESPFHQLLRETGDYEVVMAAAMKKALALRIAEEMKAKKLTKKEMAAKMQTSRSQFDRIINPTNTGISLEQLYKIASAFDKELKIEFV